MRATSSIRRYHHAVLRQGPSCLGTVRFAGSPLPVPVAQLLPADLGASGPYESTVHTHCTAESQAPELLAGCDPCRSARRNFGGYSTITVGIRKLLCTVPVQYIHYLLTLPTTTLQPLFLGNTIIYPGGSATCSHAFQSRKQYNYCTKLQAFML